MFTDAENLKKEVYHSCVEYLKQKGKIEHSDFDSSLHDYATLDDVDNKLLRDFVETAREKRNFSEKPNSPKTDILKRLNLTRNGKIANSALLLFSNNPQQFFPSATVKCAHFHGNVVQKPIPDYKEFGGTIWEMADRAVDFILSKINLQTGTRDKSNIVDTKYEIPRAAIAEAVINALAHRDYYSKASVQISVLEIVWKLKTRDDYRRKSQLMTSKKHMHHIHSIIYWQIVCSLLVQLNDLEQGQPK
jgi:ATP-dependent DNA helicase RecG